MMPTLPIKRLRLLAVYPGKRVASSQRSVRFVAIALSAALLAVPLVSTRAADVRWNLASGIGSWNVAANWNTNATPQTGDDVFNDFVNAVINFNTTATAHSFVSQGGFNLNGGTFAGSLANSLSAIQVNNTFTVNGGTLKNLTINPGDNGQGSIFGVTFAGNSNIDSVIFKANATLMTGVSVGATGTNSANGQLTFNNGNLRLNSTTLTLGNAANLTGNGVIDQGSGSALINNGTINANTSGKTLTITTNTLNNNGAVQAASGATLTVNSATTNKGAITATTGSAIFLNAGATQTAGSTTVDGTLNTSGNIFTVQGGTVGGSGTITGNINNTGGTLIPGDSPGTLTLAGNYTQGSTANMLIELGGTTQGQTYDVFKVSGAAKLDGTLNVQLVNGFTPTMGQTFDFLTYGSHTGVFGCDAKLRHLQSRRPQ